jgi:anti-sigma regulatory factor (Ser/Thr protein kinase)
VGDDNLEAGIALATSEAVGNVVRHAYGTDGGRVELYAERRDDDILVRVADSGLGLTARSGTRTGLGLPVIGRVSNGVTVASDAAGTTVSMRFALRNPAPRPRLDRFSSSRRPLIGIG